MKKTILSIFLFAFSIFSVCSCNAISPTDMPSVLTISPSIPITTTNPLTTSPTAFVSTSLVTLPPPQPLEIQALLPAGWVRNDKPVLPLRDPLGHGPMPVIAFNSWGDPLFCAGYTQNGPSFNYGTKTIMPQLKPGGAYIVMNMLTYFPGGMISSLPPEYNLNDLSGLHDDLTGSWLPFSDPPISVTTHFYKRGQFLEIWILCALDASKSTVQQLNALLNSWRFIY
jgi:hypothetical protein